MPLTEFTALFLLATAMSFTPGPNTSLATAIAANRGLRPALRFVLAVPVGWCLMLLLCFAGLGAAVLALPALRWAIKAAGIAYLLWLAWRLTRSARMAQADGSHLLVGFWEGVLLQFVNIKAWLMLLAIVASWIIGRDDGGARLLLVIPVMAGFAFASNFAYAALGALLRGWLARGQRLLWFNRGMGLVLALTALWMLAA
ncbi:MAG: lysine transporter LysE [Comamonas sp. SCN 65-56]|uniref:LysE family translocator n=1 Tax=Comamonas sp. SCN 65-56 TaxID=1660095 RepID=UPI00086F32B5|nr:LysE family translocator [Comamonas sp. SCN 65-56]ODS91032.1 MAG: lysine transporter LysE [Comamonas sp. SCN 65-56]